MKIGLIDVDSHNFPNLALMKISAFEKSRGNSVEWWNGFNHYDRVYMAKVFSKTYTEDFFTVIDADEIIQGGTGYGLKDVLPDEIEHIYPDYDLYGIQDTAFGFLTRGCPRHCPFCIVGDKEGLISHKVADLSEFWRGQKKIEIMVYKEHLRYMDFFGTKCCFYSDQRLKLYTPLGGIISLISICAMIIIFVLISLSSFKREHPNSITSSILEEEQKIKFNEEKLYIPWKIQYNKNNFNHSNILFPTIKYYSKDNKNDLLQTKILTYKFCNQTSMANIAN